VALTRPEVASGIGAVAIGDVFDARLVGEMPREWERKLKSHASNHISSGF
jgi:hypothetical protein